VKLIHGESLRFDCVKRFNHTGKAFPFSIQVSEFTQNILRSPNFQLSLIIGYKPNIIKFIVFKSILEKNSKIFDH
ncbi:hypothetical protein, partial [Limosilactobacillus kribbianus]|uniref:hypothetical protein n=1 Tax=Limosilactobacillus kribbianus TaxID=2982695 RepID=UPI002264DAB8